MFPLTVFVSKFNNYLRSCSKDLIVLSKRSYSSKNIVQSSYPSFEIPNVTIPEYIYEHFNKFPKRTAIECVASGKKFTYEEVRTKAQNFDRALRKRLHLEHGDTVAVLLPNVPEYSIILLGVLQAGLRVTTLNPIHTPDEIQRQLAAVDAKVLITQSNLTRTAKAAIKLAQKKILIIAIKSQESESLPEGTFNFAEFSDTKLDFKDALLGDGNDEVVLLHSSGTTGFPKALVHTHRSILANIFQTNAPAFKISETTTENHQDVIPAIIPFYHAYGQAIVLLGHLRNLSKIVTMPGFTPELFVKTLAEYKPHILYGVPPMVHFMSNHPSVKKEYLQSIRAIAIGAAPLGANDEHKFKKKVEKPINFLQGYGLSECCVTMLISKETRGDVTGSVGETLPNTSAKILPPDDPSGYPLGPNRSGEIYLKGPQVMKGYLNNPKETQETLVDGWIRTGDLGYYNENKVFYITGRLKELIKVNAYQVAPAELEEIIRSFPDVADAAVIGIPHDTYGEVPKAFVVANPNVKIDIGKLNEYVDEKVANYKRLKGGILVVGQIPKSAAGKILRRKLKLQYEDGV